MNFSYCSACGSMNLKSLESGLAECQMCKYIGKALYGPMDQINAFKKSVKRNENQKQEGLAQQSQPPYKSTLKERMQKLKGHTSDDSEIF